jgi:hypothetical protein
MSSKVIALIHGGIGNQLFCYAAARRLALVNGAELVLDDTSGFVHDSDYERRFQLQHFRIPCRRATGAERLQPFARLRMRLKRALNRRREFNARTYLQQEQIDFDSRLLKRGLNGTLYLEGYWQSEGYFKDVEAVIRADLTIAPPEDVLNAAMAANIRARPCVAVHVRFFDAPGSGVHNAPADYYARAVAKMDALAPGSHYFLFSDRPEMARTLIPLRDERVTTVSHNSGDASAYADLWLMQQATHFIIANSTFSWWGAWLGSRPQSVVIAPGFVVREGKAWWGFDGLLPERWIKV